MQIGLIVYRESRIATRDVRRTFMMARGWLCELHGQIDSPEGLDRRNEWQHVRNLTNCSQISP